MNWTKHPIHEAPEILGRDAEGRALARFKDGVRRMTPEQLLAFWKVREEQIANEREDPLRYGWEPPIWKKADGLLEEFRELLVLGGNRSGKSTYAAKRMMRCMLEKPNGRFWAFQTTSATSIEMQQPLLWHFMPPELRAARKTKVTNISYGQKTGFAENSFVLPNGSQIFFRNYSQDESTIEGGEVDGIWFDELVPLNFLTTARLRLVTRRGWMLLTFTPVDGYTPTVAEYLNGAETVEDREAEMLPIYGKAESGERRPESGEERDKKLVGYERVPVLQVPAVGRARILYFHTQDNPFGGYEELRDKFAHEGRDFILERVYGVPTKAVGNMFARFDDKVHVIDPDRVPREGTNYHVVDPCGGRNWAMIWARFDAAGRCFIYDEWPNQDRYIPGWGFPGPWAEPDGKRADGKPGPAQKTVGFGLLDYKAEIEAVEREHARESGERKAETGNETVEIFERLMDSRYGNAATVSRESATTLIEECAEIGLNFLAAPGDTINEGVELIKDWLAYDKTRPLDALNQPRLYVSRRCKNVIYALRTYTGQDGKHGAVKDFVDVVRYLALSGASYADAGALAVNPAGSY